MYLCTYIFHQFTYTFWRTQAHICNVCNMFYDIPALYICILPLLTVYLRYILVIHSGAVHIHSTVLKSYIHFHAYIHGIKYLLLALCDFGLVYHVSLYIYILVMSIYILPHSSACLQYILVIHSSVLHTLGRA